MRLAANIFRREPNHWRLQEPPQWGREQANSNEALGGLSPIPSRTPSLAAFPSRDFSGRKWLFSRHYTARRAPATPARIRVSRSARRGAKGAQLNHFRDDWLPHDVH